jgi:hypothetical protein
MTWAVTLSRSNVRPSSRCSGSGVPAIAMTSCRMDSTSLVVCRAAKSISAVGRRNWYAASRTLPLRTKRWRCSECARRSRNSSRAYSFRYSAVIRRSVLARFLEVQVGPPGDG